MYWILETKERGGRSREWRVVERTGKGRAEGKKQEKGKEKEKGKWYSDYTDEFRLSFTRWLS